MDELLAYLAEQVPSFKNTVRWFLGAMHNLLRRLGLDSALIPLLSQSKKPRSRMKSAGCFLLF